MRFIVRHPVLDKKVDGALLVCEANHPGSSKMIKKRLRHIVFLGGESFEGNVVVHNCEGESVFGEYHLSAAAVHCFTADALAERLLIAALLVEAEECSMPIGSWVFSGQEVKALIGKSGGFLSLITSAGCV